MSYEQTREQMQGLRLHGMAEAFEQQMTEGVFSALPFEKRVQMLIEAELSKRDTKRYVRILKAAKLKFIATPEEIEYGPGRGLDKPVMADLLSCGWISRHRNVLITGPTGTGKTWLACALAVQAARKGYSVLYKRVARLLEELSLGHDDGTVARQRMQLGKAQLLVLDDFGLTPLSARGRSELLEVLDDRIGAGSTILLGQMPVKDWHNFIDDPALADAILDRIIHSSVKIDLHGDSMRRLKKSGQ